VPEAAPALVLSDATFAPIRALEYPEIRRRKGLAGALAVDPRRPRPRLPPARGTRAASLSVPASGSISAGGAVPNRNPRDTATERPDVTSSETHPGRRLLAQWVGLAYRRPVLVLLLTALLSAAAGYLASGLRIDTDTTDMLAPDLPFRQHNAALSKAFPQSSDTIAVVIEAPTPEQAQADAAGLAEALRQNPALFEQVFYPEGEPFFRRNGLLYLDLPELERLSDRLAEAEPLLATLAADPSLRGLSRTLEQALDTARDQGAASADAKRVAPLLTALAKTAEGVAKDGSGAAPLSWRNLVEDGDGTAATARRIIEVKPVLDYGSLQPAAAAIAEIRALAAAQGVQARLTGSAVLFQEELDSLRRGMGLVGLMSTVLVLGLLAIGLRSVPLVAGTLLALVAGLLWTAGFAALAVGRLNLISIAFAVLFLGLSVDFGIHLALRFKEFFDRGTAPPEALGQAARDVGGALTLCAVAAALAFFSFLPTDYLGVAELGLISGAGMFIALIANLTVLPAVLGLLPLRRGAAPPGSPPGSPPGTSPDRPLGSSPDRSLGGRLQRLAAARPRSILLVAALLGVAALALLPAARFDDDPMNLRDPQSESVKTLRALGDDPRIQTYSAELLMPDARSAERMARRLETLPEVADAVSPDDLVPRNQDDKLLVIENMAIFLTPVLTATPAAPPDTAARQRALADLRRHLADAGGALAGPAARLTAALGALPSDGATLLHLEHAWLGNLPGLLSDLGQALEAGPVTRADLPPDLLGRYLTPDGRARIEIRPRADLRDPAARARFVAAVRAVAPAVAGAPVTITEAGAAVVQAFGEAALYAMAAIVLLLVAVLRNLRDSLFVLLPLVLAALLTVAATVLLDMPFNFANVIVLPLLFGLGVAGGIHVVVRARQDGAGTVAGGSTPRAVLFSALTTIGSFGSLALSSHRGTASMGILLTIAIVLSLLATLVVLPALLQVAPPSTTVARVWHMRRPRPVHALALLIGLGVFVVVAHRTDLGTVWHDAARLGALGLAAVCGVYLAVFVAGTASWQLMLPGVRPTPRWLYRLCKVRILGEALNLVIPGGSLGGEPFKAILLRRGYEIDYDEGGASLTVAGTVNLLALVCFAAIGFALLLGEISPTGGLRPLAGFGLGALAAVVAGLYAVQQWRAAGRLATWLSRRDADRRLVDVLQRAQEADDRFERFHAERPARFAVAFALAFGALAIGAAEVGLIMWLVGRPVGFAEAWLIEAVAQLVRAATFFVPASLGFSEAAMLLLYDALMGRPALGLAVALIRRARELVWLAWGLWLGWLAPLGFANGASVEDERQGP